MLVSPTAPTTAFPLGERVDDPLAMYLADLCTIPANLAGTRGVRAGRAGREDGLPVGLQVMAPALADDRAYRVGAALRGRSGLRCGGPLRRPGPIPPRYRGVMTSTVEADAVHRRRGPRALRPRAGA